MSENLELFELYGCWQESFKNLSKSLYETLGNRVIKSPEISALSKLIFAIDRLPLTTENIGIELCSSTEHEYGSAWMEIQLYENSLTLRSAESFNETQGVETEFYTVLDIDLGSYSNRENEDPITVMNELEDWVYRLSKQLLDNDYKFYICDDFDEMNWEQPSINDPWSKLRDGV